MFVYWIHRETHHDPWNDGYVGVTRYPTKRLKGHKHNQQNPHLSRALRAYDDVQMSILYEGPKEDCLATEILLRPREHIGWNIAPGGGIPPSAKGKPAPWAVERCRQLGKSRAGKPSPHSIELGRQNGKACKGRSAPWAIETAKKMSIGNTGKPSKLRGRKLGPRDPEVGKKISAKRKGMKFTEEHRKNISESHKGYKWTKEAIEKRTKTWRENYWRRKQNVVT